MAWATVAFVLAVQVACFFIMSGILSAAQLGVNTINNIGEERLRRLRRLRWL